MSMSASARAYLQLMRAPNCAMAGFASLIGWLIAYSLIGGNPALAPVVFAVVFLITGAGNTLNDYFDVEIDRINRPERPLPSGSITLKACLYFSLLLFITGIALSSLLGALCIIIAVMNSVLLAFYAARLKQALLLGNLSVGYLTGSTFLFGGAVFGLEGMKVTLVLFLLSMLATLSREIIKDVEDMQGDRAKGARTFPIAYSERTALGFSALLIIVAVMLSPLPLVQMMPDGRPLFGTEYLVGVAVADLLFAASIAAFFLSGSHRSTLLKLAMFVALLSFIIGALLR